MKFEKTAPTSSTDYRNAQKGDKVMITPSDGMNPIAGTILGMKEFAGSKIWTVQKEDSEETFPYNPDSQSTVRIEVINIYTDSSFLFERNARAKGGQCAQFFVWIEFLKACC